MNTLPLITSAITGYLVGSFSFARLVTWIINPTLDLNDVRTHRAEDGKTGTVSGIGASTASIALGKRYGGLIALLDILKAFLPVLWLRLYFPAETYHFVYSLLCIVGHNYPLYYRFQGGRGLSPMLGSLLALEPLGLLVCILAGVALGVLINQPHLSLIIWFPIFGLWGLFIENDRALAIYAFALLGIFLVAEIPEIKLARQYQMQGRLDEYNKMILNSAPQTRIMKRLAERVRFWDANRS